MDGQDPHRDSDPQAVRATASRGRASSSREAAFVALWAVVGAVFVVAYLRVGLELWAGSRGVAVIVALAGLALLLRVAGARTRTVRPRHYNAVEGAAAVWLGVGVGVTGMVLGIFDGSEVSTLTALLAALVLSAPLFGCAVWLAVRGR